MMAPTSEQPLLFISPTATSIATSSSHNANTQHTQAVLLSTHPLPLSLALPFLRLIPFRSLTTLPPILLPQLLLPLLPPTQLPLQPRLNHPRKCNMSVFTFSANI